VEKLEKLDGRLFKIAFKKATEVLMIHKDEINELNVFPVPDGDTGSNMLAAMVEACRRLDELKSDFLPDVLDAITKGTLMGARGNSGVILSQIFRGLSEALSNKSEISVEDFVYALDNARRIAYGAVIKPVEGTLLTLIRLLANYAKKELKYFKDFKDLFVKLQIAAEKIVEMTPKFLDKLKESGVVDAGAKGFYYIIQGFKEAILGDTKVREILLEVDTEKLFKIAKEDIKNQYCTEVMINSTMRGEELERYVEDLKKSLVEIGDSVVVVNAGGIVRLHVHTNHPGVAIEKSLEIGEIIKVKIDNMKIQHTELMMGEVEDKKKRKKYGMVTVSPGEGITRIMKGLGVDKVISGGQTMNPSTADFKEAIDSVEADTIFVFPNNSNVILSAQRAAEMTEDKEVIVIPTRTVQEGISAIVEFREDLEKDELLKNIKQVINKVRSISVTYAIRDSSFNGVKIKKGDFLVFLNDELVGSGKHLFKLIRESLKIGKGEEHELVTIYYGKDASEEEAKALASFIEENFTDLEVEIYEGGQPHYKFLISLE